MIAAETNSRSLARLAARLAFWVRCFEAVIAISPEASRREPSALARRARAPAVIGRSVSSTRSVEVVCRRLTFCPPGPVEGVKTNVRRAGSMRTPGAISKEAGDGGLSW